MLFINLLRLNVLFAFSFVTAKISPLIKVVVEYRELDFDHTVIGPTHKFKAGEWPEIDFIIYLEPDYGYTSGDLGLFKFRKF